MASKKRMTKAQTRVAIAKDVLKALDTKRIKATSGTYLQTSKAAARALAASVGIEARKDAYGDLEYNVADDKFDAQPRKPVKAPKACRVCAIGSVFVAAVDRFDKLTIGQTQAAILGGEVAAMREYLDPWFSHDQLSLIEAVYEGWTHSLPIGVSADDVDAEVERISGRPFNGGTERAAVAHSRVTADKRMRAIMSNIIAHRGTYVLPERNAP